MKAEDIVAYFMRKIAKPIMFDIKLSYDRHEEHRSFYAIEPTAVRDQTLHVMVAFRHDIERDGSKRGTSHHCGEAEIPLADGDTIESVLDMAIAQAVFSDDISNVRDADHRIAKAHAEVRSRLGQISNDQRSPRF